MERLVLLLGRAKAELSEARKAEGGKNAYAIPLQSVDSRIGDCRQGVLISSDFREMSLLFEGIDKLCDCSLEDEFAEISEEFFDEYRQCRKMQGKLASP
ncbi:hypothetical protein JW721_05445 [Candidatus Micrarchaeota archaeon]|nr:hypothetical protein [Candidatus Micrarchaeota archaeon]